MTSWDDVARDDRTSASNTPRSEGSLRRGMVPPSSEYRVPSSGIRFPSEEDAGVDRVADGVEVEEEDGVVEVRGAWM